jgi:soluble lytic murein transglycosylase-like protein
MGLHRFCVFSFSILVSWACLAGSALGNVAHTVAPGETLWSIAAASNFTTRALAAANGLSPDANVVVGSTIQIPSEGEAAVALSGAPVTASAARAPAPMGGFVVRSGDSLSGIAARSGVSPQAVAAMNGLDPRAYLLSGTVLKLPTGAPVQRAAPAPARRVVPKAAPAPTPGRVTASQIGQIAAANGVSPSLAASIAWQESGFNNAMVSSANARGVMQVTPGAWSWVKSQLARGPLDPASPNDNVRAGVMYLGSLLRSTGGNSDLAAGAYYQGLSSVRHVGLLPETRRYVANVQALRARFGQP